MTKKFADVYAELFGATWNSVYLKDVEVLNENIRTYETVSREKGLVALSYDKHSMSHRDMSSSTPTLPIICVVLQSIFPKCELGLERPLYLVKYVKM